jgi:hypothetical protein
MAPASAFVFAKVRSVPSRDTIGHTSRPAIIRRKLRIIEERKIASTTIIAIAANNRLETTMIDRWESICSDASDE